MYRVTNYLIAVNEHNTVAWALVRLTQLYMAGSNMDFAKQYLKGADAILRTGAVSNEVSRAIYALQRDLGITDG